VRETKLSHEKEVPGSRIHPTAIVDKKAKLGDRVTIGPFCIVGPEVVLADDVCLDSHVVVNGKTSIGARTRISPFASVGTDPQDLKYRGEATVLECGEDNKIREYVTLSIGTDGGGGITRIGNRNLFMANTHIAHDCQVGNDCIFANGVSVGGHVEIDDHAVLGGHAAVHQFTKIGKMAMLAGGSIVVQDVPPFLTVAGNHAVPTGLNLTGIRRSDIERERLGDLKTMYKLLYRSNLNLEDAISAMIQELPESKELTAFTTFLKNSKRGICR
jgi:UDP-N-acetylglucosamine acyltransferase